MYAVIPFNRDSPPNHTVTRSLTLPPYPPLPILPVYHLARLSGASCTP